MTPRTGREQMAVTVTPAPPLTAEQQLGQAAAQHERAQHELTRTRNELIDTVAIVEESLTVTAISKQLGVSRQQVYNLLKQGRE